MTKSLFAFFWASVMVFALVASRMASAQIWSSPRAVLKSAEVGHLVRFDAVVAMSLFGDGLRYF